MSNWLTYSPSSGYGDGTIRITASTYSELEERVETIVSYNTHYNLSASTTVIQDNSSFSSEYLTFNIISGGNITYKFVQMISGYIDGGLYYKINDGNWSEYPDDDFQISVNDGDKVYFKGYNDYYATYPGLRFFTFSGSTAYFNLEGNIMSLIYGDNFIGKSTLPEENNFIYMFRNTNVVNANNLVLPASNLPSRCYWGMFLDCTSLITPPLKVGRNRYSISIGTSDNCKAMFAGCTSLTTAPELPAETMGSGSYNDMFCGCTSLTVATELPAWQNLEAGCYAGMFKGCTSLTKAPELYASLIYENSYADMFNGCTNLNYICCLATAATYNTSYTAETIPISRATTNWVLNVPPTGTFVKNQNM